ncbi:MAG: rhamnogalacturonan acetylesterase [Clostridia bacterium]|nr:rhamnogalacturonan acetylesterase [Clostridia bacterium]
MIWIIGDSTVEDNKPPFRGWGWAMPGFTREGVTVRNEALSGRSSRSFREDGLFEPVEREMAAGDLLLIQFGHNDEKDDERHTDPDSTFPEQLRRYCDAALEKGAQPVLMTPVSRRFFVGDGSLLYTHGEYPRAIRKLAEETGIPLIDLKQMSRELYMSLGEQKAEELFVHFSPGENADYPDGYSDKTHFNAYGAKVICELVVNGMRGIPVCAPFLKDNGKD